MEAQTRPAQSKLTQLGELLAEADSVNRPRAPKPDTGPVEPQMHALRRILGDDVLDIFPEGLCDVVDGFYVAHSQDENAWAEVAFDSHEEAKDSLTLMRAYAECADGTGYTIRQDRTANPAVLRFRVITRKTRKADADAGADS